MIRFIVGSRGVEVDAKSLMLKCLRDIWTQSEDKTIATKVISFIHISSQVDSNTPFFQARADEVQELAARNLWGESWETNPEIAPLSQWSQAITDYLEAYDKPENRSIRIYNRKLDQIDDLLTDIVPKIEKSLNANTGTFTWQNNTKAITDLMKNKNMIIKERNQLEDSIKNSSQQSAKVRGEKTLSFTEKKQLKRELQAYERNNSNGTEDEEGEAYVPEEFLESSEAVTSSTERGSTGTRQHGAIRVGVPARQRRQSRTGTRQSENGEDD